MNNNKIHIPVKSYDSDSTKSYLYFSCKKIQISRFAQNQKKKKSIKNYESQKKIHYFEFSEYKLLFLQEFVTLIVNGLNK